MTMTYEERLQDMAHDERLKTISALFPMDARDVDLEREDKDMSSQTATECLFIWFQVNV